MTRRDDAYSDLLPTGPILPTVGDVTAHLGATTPEQREEAPDAQLGTWRVASDYQRIEGRNETWRILGSDLGEDYGQDGDIEIVKFTCSGSRRAPHGPVYVGEAWRMEDSTHWYLHEYHGRQVQVRPDGGIRAQSEGKADFLLDRLSAVQTDEMRAAEAAEAAAQEVGDDEAARAAGKRWQRANMARAARLIEEGKLPTAYDHVVFVFNCPECPLDLRVNERSAWRESLNLFLEGALAAGVDLTVKGAERLLEVPVRVLERKS